MEKLFAVGKESRTSISFSLPHKKERRKRMEEDNNIIHIYLLDFFFWHCQQLVSGKQYITRKSTFKTQTLGIDGIRP